MKNLIYAFVDAEGRVFYIGKTCNLNRRSKEHLFEVKRGNTLPKYNKLRKLINSGIEFSNLIKIIEENISCEDIDEREIFYIKKMREEGYKLKNLTSGGTKGLKFNKQTIEKMKKSRTGFKFSEESKKKISESRKGMIFTEEHKKKLSIARKKRITTQETKDKASKTSKGKINIKKFKLLDPHGNIYITEFGLTKFCEEHNLTSSNFFKVLKGERDNVKGWKIERVL